MEAPATPSVATDTLYAIIGAVAEGPDLDRVLRAVVDLLVQATSCHACFVYLREDDELRIRAASPVFAHVVGRVALRMDEGLTGWVARHRQPAFIREAALDDHRMKYVPELEEERFQSMVAVPLIDRHGDVIGVVVLHTQAPREFGQDVLDLLVHVASLVVGAIDNARLFDQTQRQVAALSALARLGQALASQTALADLYETGCAGIAEMLDANVCRLLLSDGRGVATEVAAIGPTGASGADEMIHAPADGCLLARITDEERAMGVIAVRRDRAFSGSEMQLLEASANQLALALRKAELIERLAAENLVRELFDALEHGSPSSAARRALTAGWDPGRPHVAVVAAAVDDVSWSGDLPIEVERRLRFAARGALSDVGPERLRALVPVPGSRGDIVTSLTALHADLARIGSELGVVFGISQTRRDLVEHAVSLREAADALTVARSLAPAGGARRFDELGAYRYLVAHAGSHGPDQVHARALTVLAEYDARRHAELLKTLEVYLGVRGATTATATALMIHPNTLRQRLRRIEELTGLDLDAEDLLSLELGVKVHRLRGRRARASLTED